MSELSRARIDELVNWPFEQVAALLVGAADATDFDALLRDHANLTAYEFALVARLPRDLHPMKVLQSVVPVLSEAPDLGFGEADQGIYAAAKLPAVVATHLRGEAVTLDVEYGYCERFLTAIGTRPDGSLLEAFNAAQILQLEHSMNAGTFAARVVASTLATVESAMAAGIGALSGPLHGGADEAALDIVDRLDGPDAAIAYVDELLRTGGKLPGMGHREYRVRDPRALYLEQWAQQLSAGTAHERSFATLRALERRFREHMEADARSLHANVEFYKGLVYRMAGLPNRFFTAGFAMARAFGYVAHFIESRQDNRIYRPAAEYVGRRVA